MCSYTQLQGWRCCYSAPLGCNHCLFQCLLPFHGLQTFWPLTSTETPHNRWMFSLFGSKGLFECGSPSVSLSSLCNSAVHSHLNRLSSQIRCFSKVPSKRKHAKMHLTCRLCNFVVVNLHNKDRESWRTTALHVHKNHTDPIFSLFTLLSTTLYIHILYFIYSVSTLIIKSLLF